MAAFIVISANDNLHYLVDGIEKCRPLNPNVLTHISTGKIKSSDSGFFYEFSLNGELTTGEDAKSFNYYLVNQFAQFRLIHTIQDDELVNIFFLDNPLNEHELQISESWFNEFDKVYLHDKNFRLFRVLFTYNLNNPEDVKQQIEYSTLLSLLKNHIDIQNNLPTYSKYLFFIDNQTKNGAALCIDKNDHDLKMTRFLIDFMMLASNNTDQYNIMSSINPPIISTKCFSIGFAESMYYYSDVENYLKHASIRDLHDKFISSDDKIIESEGLDSMNIEKYPFGLRNRKERLGKIYNDIPFSEKIENYPSSADYEIDNCITKLNDLLIEKRNKEKDIFDKSKEVLNHKTNIENIEKQISSAIQEETESVEDFNIRINRLQEQKAMVKEKLNKLEENFNQEYPEYIDRTSIYNTLCVTDDIEKEALTYKLSNKYNLLLNYIKSAKFSNFVQNNISNTITNDNEIEQQNTYNNQQQVNQGCLSWLFFWKKQSKYNETTTESNPDISTQECQNNSNPYDLIICIAERLNLKKQFVEFKTKVKEIEEIYHKEKEYCEQFKLTVHTNHYFPLINLNRLKTTTLININEIIDKWKHENNPTKTSLISLTKNFVSEYTLNNFSYIDWENPFPFLEDVTTNLPTICNELQKRSAPFVNYYTTTEFKENNITRCLFSDLHNFEDLFKQNCTHIRNSNYISATYSTHIASKICMLQFLPLDEDVLKNLVDLGNEINN